MPHAPSNPDPSNPLHNGRPLTEDEILDWIDGRISTEQATRTAKASGRPDLPERVAQMQRHRALLVGMGDAKAPPELLERVMATLERDALLGSASADGVRASQNADDLAAAAILDRSADTAGMIQGENDGAWNTASPELQAHRELTDFTPQAASRRSPFRFAPLAMAALVACAIGSALYFGPGVAERFSSPSEIHPLVQAQTDTPSHGSPLAHAGETAKERKPSQAKLADASSAGQKPEPIITKAAQGTLRDTGAPSAQFAFSRERSQGIAADIAPAVAAMADQAQASAPDRALELAREGRLVLRVFSKDTRNLQRVSEEIATPSSSRSWTMSRDVPPATVAAMLPVPTRGLRGESGADESAFAERTIFATADQRTGSGLLSALAGPRAALTMSLPTPTDPSSGVRGTFVLHMPRTRQALDAFRAVVQDQLRARVVFDEAASTLDVPRRAQPEQELWWLRPAGEWIDRVSVPVIVQVDG